MKVTQNAGNGISESSDFQNIPGEHVPRPPFPLTTVTFTNNFHLPLSLIGVQLQPCDKTVSCKKMLNR